MGSAWPGRGGGQYRPEGCRATSSGIGAEGPGIDFSACSSPTRRMPGPYKCYLDTEACSEGSNGAQRTERTLSQSSGEEAGTASPRLQRDKCKPTVVCRSRPSVNSLTKQPFLTS